jgi:tetratricopeptide (TPR) repeat protein
MLDALLADAWDYHDAESERLATELEREAGAAEERQLDPLLHLVGHTIGEHLGDWPRAQRLADQVMAGRTPTKEAARAWSRLGVIRLMTGDVAGGSAADLAAASAAENPLAAMVEARFLLIAALVGSKSAASAEDVYAEALTLARRLGDTAPSRAIAVASNNLASELVEAKTRTPAEDALMALAAEAAHEFWLKIGTWQHDERARYLKALVANALGRPNEALGHADAALEIIAANGEAPIDQTFLTLARSRSLALLGRADDSAGALAKSDAAAAAWDDQGLKDWYVEERARAGF